MKIGEVVQSYRERYGMSQRDFARRCGLSSAIISFLEAGKRPNGSAYLPRIDTVKKVASGMGITPEMLLAQSEDFDLDISVGPEETPLVEDFIRELQNQSPDESMLIQIYRLIPMDHRYEAISALLKIKEKYEQ